MIRRYTLLAEGSTDNTLLPILDWSLHHCGANLQWKGEFTKKNSGENLIQSIQRAIEDYPCDLLFVHRDADREPSDTRYQEIQTALISAEIASPAVCVVPIRMTEAWLMFDEAILRRVVANRNVRVDIGLPPISQLENLANPKEKLRHVLRTASERRGRRLDELNRDIPVLMRQITTRTDDFSPLLHLSAFQRLQEDVRTILTEQGWR